MIQPKQGDFIIDTPKVKKDLIYTIQKVDFKNKVIHAMDVVTGDFVTFEYDDIVSEALKYFPKTFWVLG